MRIDMLPISFAQLLQYGTAPALMILCFLIVQMRGDIIELTKKQQKLDDRIREAEHEYVPKDDCASDMDQINTKMQAIFNKLDTVGESISFISGKMDFRKGG